MKTSATPGAAPAPAKYPFSVIRARMRAHGDGLLDFAIGGDAPVAPADIAETVRETPEHALTRCTPAQTARVAELGAALMAREYGVTVEPDQVLPVPGGRAGIAVFASTVLAPGDAVVVTRPSYPSIERASEQHRADVVAVGMDPGRGFLPDLGQLGARMASVRVMTMSYPHNPTGEVLTDEAIAACTEGLPDDAVLFNDATYGPMVYDCGARSLLGSPELLGGRPVIELQSLSKLFGLAGLPVAFLVGDAGLVEQIRRYSEYVWTPPSQAQAVISARCLGDGAHLATLREIYGARITTLRAVLKTLGFRPFEAPGGMYVLCPTPRSVGGLPCDDAWHAAEVMLETLGLAVMPWDDAAGGRGYVRFSSMFAPADLDALRALGPRLAIEPA